MRKYLVVVSVQEDYAERLCHALGERDGCMLTPVYYRNAEDGIAFCRTHPAAVILADEELAEGGAFSGIPGNPVLIRLVENREGSLLPEQLYRYSGIEEILRRLAACTGSTSIAGNVQQGGRNVKLTGVYSPALLSLKTACAVTMAAIGKRERKTLYLNLEEFGGTGRILKSSGEKTLADAVYYLKQDSLDAPKLLSMICTAGSVDHIPPMPFADDVREAGGEEWVRLIGRIAELTDYEEIIVDLPQSLFVSLEVIEACDELYVLAGGDGIAAARMEEMEQYLNRPEHRALRAKTRRIRMMDVPLPGTGQGGDYAEELMYGRFGEALLEEMDFECG